MGCERIRKMTEEKQRRNAVVRQARSSETHQRESHAGVRESRPCLIKDAAAIMRQKGQTGGRAVSSRLEGRPAYPIKPEEEV